MILLRQALVGAADLIVHMALPETQRAPPHPNCWSVPDQMAQTHPKRESGDHGWRGWAAFFPLMSLFFILNQRPMVISHSVAFISQLCRDYCRIKGAFTRLLGGACALPPAMEMNHSRDFHLPSNQCKKPLFSSASKPACK